MSMVSLHLDLSRSIAVPLKRLRCLMSDISGDAEPGSKKGLSSGLLSERLTQGEARLAGRITDIKELVTSFDAMIKAVNVHVDEIKAAEGRLQKLATTDELTQAFNRSMFEEIIGSEMDRAARVRQPIYLNITQKYSLVGLFSNNPEGMPGAHSRRLAFHGFKQIAWHQ